MVLCLLRGEFLLKLCPLRLQPAKHISRGPRRQHQSPVLLQSSREGPQTSPSLLETQLSFAQASGEPSRKAGPGGPGPSAWLRPGSSRLSSAGESRTKHFAPCPCKSGLKDKPSISASAIGSHYQPIAPPNNTGSENLPRLHGFIFRNSSETRQQHPAVEIGDRYFR